MKSTWSTSLLLLLALSAPGSAAVPAPAEKPDADNCTWYLSFEKFFANRKGAEQPMKIYVVRRGGRFLHAVGSSPTWNTCTHLADTSGLEFAAGRLRGKLKITLQADPWVPQDQKPIECLVEVDAKVDVGKAGQDGAIDGTYDGTFGSQKRSGKLGGKLASPKMTPFDAATLDLSLTEGLAGEGNPWDRRLLVRLHVQDGKVTGGEFSATDLKGAPKLFQTLAAADVQLTQDQFSGEFSFDHEVLGAVGDAQAAYRFTIEGKRVDDLLGGKFTVKITPKAGKEIVKTAGFKGWVKPGGAAVARSIWADEKDASPWFVPVKGWRPVKPGEHPRLFFRKSDLPELRHRAETAEGKALLARLRATLGGGEAMPQHFSKAKRAYDDSVREKLPEGAYTISHAAGFGLLFQLTGERKYADLGRKCVELAFEGQRDRDDRYAWRAPGGELRAGPSIAWYAAAYDLCYDGWDEAFRKKVALAIQDYDDSKAGEWTKPEGVSLHKMIVSPKQTPASNHFGAVVGGCGIAVLAVLGDPGTDDARLRSYLNKIERDVVLALTKGFGDHGYFSENAGPSHVAANSALVPLFQALKVAAGRDCVSPRPNAQWVTMRWAMELLADAKGNPIYPCRRPSNYGGPDFLSGGGGGISHGGWFSGGFGSVLDEQKPALLWTYNHFVAEADQHRCNAVIYPHHALLSFINWPIGMKEKNPAEVLPKAVVDKIHGYYVFRNRWQDKDDIVVTVLLTSGPQGYIKIGPDDVMVWGLGRREKLGTFGFSVQTTYYRAAKDGSGVVAGSCGNCLAVDFSRASGADALVVMTGPGAKEGAAVQAGKTTFHVLTLQQGQPPKIEVAGDGLRIGRQTVGFDGKKIVLGTLSGQ